MIECSNRDLGTLDFEAERQPKQKSSFSLSKKNSFPLDINHKKILIQKMPIIGTHFKVLNVCKNY